VAQAHRHPNAGFLYPFLGLKNSAAQAVIGDN
jgi:hypothetical protein